MSQTIAILQDSMRELKSRSLFWFTLSISVIVSVALFGLIGFDDKGWYILWFDTNEFDLLKKGSPGARDLMGWLFGGALMWWWLTWGSIIVALIATAGMVPDLVTGGAIDLALSKPISRVKLFGTKVLGAMVFTLLQVTICVSIAYLLLGLRFGMWFHQAWLAVPLVTLQFLYLYVVMAFVGLVTRSTLTSLLVVLLFWGMVSLVQLAENQMNRIVTEAKSTVNAAETRITDIRKRAEDEGRKINVLEEGRINGAEARAQPMRSLIGAVEPWHGRVSVFELCVPKTGDLQKIIAARMDAPTLDELIMRLNGFDPEQIAKMTGDDVETARDMQSAGVAGSRAVRDVDPWKSICSSLIFTGLVFGASLWVFCRRDF